MATQRTALGRRLTEQRKARARLLLLTFLALLAPPLAGIESIVAWASYTVFAVVYALWVLRLSTRFAHDRRLGYLLCLSDLAVLLPLLVWSSSAAVRVVVVAVGVTGLAVTHLAGRSGAGSQHNPADGILLPNGSDGHGIAEGAAASLERAVRLRLAVFRATGSRFALVMFRVLRFQETADYYGDESSRRILAAVSRRGLRLLGPDAQHFVLPGGRVAFLFEIDTDRMPSEPRTAAADWADPTDVEGLAMALGRKTCERLVDGHRVECVVGWASAPSDGLSADDLMDVAEAGAQSTAAFRRAAGQVGVPDRARVAAG